MEPKLAALKAFLEELGIVADISTLSKRKLIQKGLLLGQQLADVDLGYRYSWYLRGPYSTHLAKSYYELAHALRVAPDEKPKLPAPSRDRLRALRPLLLVPADVALSQPDWLELLASVQYLLTERKLTQSQVDKTINDEKPHLAAHLPAAYRELAKHQKKAA